MRASSLALLFALASCSSFTENTPKGADGGTQAQGGAAVCSSIELDGNAAYVEIPGASAALGLSSFTVEAWVMLLGDVADDEMHIVSNGDWEASDGWMLGMRQGNVDARIYSGTGTGKARYLSVPAPAAGAWHHLALVYDGASRRAALLVDGKGLVTGATEDVAPPDPRSGPLRFGVDAAGERFFFNGRIDELRIMSVAAYQEGMTPPYPLPDDEPGTVAVWHFSEGAGSTSAEARGRPGMVATLTTGLSAVKWAAECARH